MTLITAKDANRLSDGCFEGARQRRIEHLLDMCDKSIRNACGEGHKTSALTVSDEYSTAEVVTVQHELMEAGYSVRYILNPNTEDFNAKFMMSISWQEV